MRTSLTAPAVRSRKVRDGRQPLVMVTAYDAPGARMADEAGVDLILVGPSTRFPRRAPHREPAWRTPAQGRLLNRGRLAGPTA